MNGWSRGAISALAFWMSLGCGGKVLLERDRDPTGGNGLGFAGSNDVSFAGTSNATGGAAGSGEPSAGGSVVVDPGAGGVGFPSGGTTCIPRPTTQGDTGGQSFDSFDGTWNGQVDNYRFDDQSNAMTLDISKTDGTQQIIFGNSSTYPLATSAVADYPPGTVLDLPAKPLVSGPHSGFGYTLLNGKYDGCRLQFDVAPFEFYQSWCALQTAYPDAATGKYACLPQWQDGGGNRNCYQLDPQRMQPVPRPCPQVVLCSVHPVCSCTERGCAARFDDLVHFDILWNQWGMANSTITIEGLQYAIHFIGF